MSTREQVALSDDEARAVRAGRWVKVSLGKYVELPIGRTKSALVGPGRDASGARTVIAWANACLHQPTPLDTTSEPVAISPGVCAAPMDDDRVHLLCHSHGALYRPSDGYCTSGPCVEQSLVPLDVQDDGGTIAVVLPDEDA